jgi:PAS domain S-box-containing protein
VKKTQTAPPPIASLQRRAEAFIGKGGSARSRVNLADVQRLVHELEVHHVELEMQNEELRRTQFELAQSRDRYASLYESAPIAYFTLERDDTILEANHAAVKMLGVEHNKLIGRGRFFHFVARESQDIWHIFRSGLFEPHETKSHERRDPGVEVFSFLTLPTPTAAGDRFEAEMREAQPYRCEVTLVGTRGKRFDVILFGTLVDFGQRPALILAVTDITARKRDEMERARYQKRLRQLTMRLVAAQEAEQQRIAEGLHDEVAQLLVTCTVKLALMRRAQDPSTAQQLGDELEALLGQADTKLRTMMFDLATPTLRRLGLKEALVELCESMHQRYGVRFRFEDDGREKPLTKVAANVFFKVGRELLFNVVKHAGVDHATMYLNRVGNELKMRVEDDGMGFKDPAVGHDPLAGQGLGLFWACERLRDIGGTMNIESEPGVLTRVTVQAPIENGST